MIMSYKATPFTATVKMAYKNNKRTIVRKMFRTPGLVLSNDYFESASRSMSSRVAFSYGYASDNLPKKSRRSAGVQRQRDQEITKYPFFLLFLVLKYGNVAARFLEG